MSKRRVIFTFGEEHIPDPIIFNLGQQYNLVTNILRANVSEHEGWVVLEMEGDDNDMEQGIAWVTSKGIRVDPADSSR
jgi:ABC-type methionine transport system ATPase subunit